jgi:hypothetical protein
VNTFPRRRTETGRLRYQTVDVAAREPEGSSRMIGHRDPVPSTRCSQYIRRLVRAT